jgi:hypothetical protein
MKRWFIVMLVRKSHFINRDYDDKGELERDLSKKFNKRKEK